MALPDTLPAFAAIWLRNPFRIRVSLREPGKIWVILGDNYHMKQESAELIGLQALGWLAGNDDLFPGFLGSTGADAQSVAAQAGDAVFLASVLDYILMEDGWVIAFCDAVGLPYTQPRLARAYLPGGEALWT